MKRIRLFALLLAAALLMPGCGNAKAEKQQELKRAGMELQAAGDYDGAIKKYEKALKEADMKVGAEEIDIARYKASAQYRNGDLAGALDTYSAVLAVKEDEESYLSGGILYMAAGETKKAEKDLNKALKKTDDELTKGMIYNAIGDNGKAKECFEKAKADGNTQAGYYLANVYEKSGDHNYAMILLEEYIGSGKATAEGYLSAGRSYFEDGEYEKALKTVQEGIALGDSGVLKTLLQEETACMEKMGDFAGAAQKAAAYLEKYPDDALMQREAEFLAQYTDHE